MACGTSVSAAGAELRHRLGGGDVHLAELADVLVGGVEQAVEIVRVGNKRIGGLALRSAFDGAPVGRVWRIRR